MALTEVRSSSKYGVVNVYYSLFESRIMTKVPKKTNIMAVMSYLGTNFSPRYFAEMKTFIKTAELELHAINVRSANGSAMKWPKNPTMINNIATMPLHEQNTAFSIVLSELIVYFFFSSSLCASFCTANVT